MFRQSRLWTLCGCTALGFASLHLALAATVTVYPTGSFPLDVTNVQAALDGGGTVVLKAKNKSGQPTAFNFGYGEDAYGVGLTTDVRIFGERIGKNMTTISGGYIPILGLTPVKSTIEGIDFEGPIDSPVVLAASTGADFIGNRVQGVIPSPLCAAPCTYTEVEGILISGYNDPANAVTGRVRVLDNDFELSGGSFANGLQFDEVAADIEVSGNTIHFLVSDGILQTIGILVFRSHGRADVVGNSVTLGSGDPDAYPVGIFIGGHEEARYFILGNNVTTYHPKSDGIDVVGLSNSGSTEHAIVEGNRINIHSTLTTAGGLGFDGAVNHSLMATNVISGTSGNAVQMLGLDSTLVADSNTSIANDIARFTSSDADVYFGTDSTNNLYIGHCSTFVDLGNSNRIACGHPITERSAARSNGFGTLQAGRPRPMIDLLGNFIRPAGIDGTRHVTR